MRSSAAPHPVLGPTALRSGDPTVRQDRPGLSLAFSLVSAGDDTVRGRDGSFLIHHRYCHSIVGTFTRLPPICLSLRSPWSNANRPSLLHAASWTSSASDSLSRLEYWRSAEDSQLASISPP